MKKKNIYAILMILICSLFISIPVAAKTQNVTKVTKKVFTVSNSRYYYRYYGYNSSGRKVWTYKTETTSYTELSGSDIDKKPIIKNGLVYIGMNTRVIALNKNTGKVSWKTKKNTIGMITDYCFDKSGNIYICGYYGPDLVKISKKGKVGWRKEHVVNSSYYWTYDVRIKSNYLLLTYDYPRTIQVKVSMKTGKRL